MEATRIATIVAAVGVQSKLVNLIVGPAPQIVSSTVSMRSFMLATRVEIAFIAYLTAALCLGLVERNRLAKREQMTSRYQASDELAAFARVHIQLSHSSRKPRWLRIDLALKPHEVGT